MTQKRTSQALTVVAIINATDYAVCGYALSDASSDAGSKIACHEEFTANAGL